jgi:hypothetical protein
MKKLSMLFVVAALALGGCKKSVDKEKPDEKGTPKPVDEVKPATPDKPADPAKPADGTKPADDTAKPADTTKPAEATATLLPECQAYQDAIKKLEACDKIGADTKKTFDDAFAQASKAWANLPAESKDTVAKACKQAADGVTAAAAACK